MKPCTACIQVKTLLLRILGHRYPSSKHRRRVSVGRFLSCNHFLKCGERIVHWLVVVTSFVSTIRGTTLLP
uniref:Uncharacterized protein n=1 Tax=Rhizophora mucronata TaxID=61149 RepID=A0A2P2P008_RHIMU